VAWPLEPRSGYWLRIVAFEPATALTVTGVSGLLTALDAGAVTQARTTGPARIVSNRPILVAQVAEGGTADKVDGADPCFALLPPAGAGASAYRVAAPPGLAVATAFANIVAPSGAAGTIRLNGTVIDPGTFIPLGSGGYAGATVPLASGPNLIESAGARFDVLAYGWGDLSNANGFCYSPTLRF
jgi:hypothetical protein